MEPHSSYILYFISTLILSSCVLLETRYISKDRFGDDSVKHHDSSITRMTMHKDEQTLPEQHYLFMNNSISDKIVKGPFTVAWRCDVCKVIIGLIQAFVAQNKTQDEIQKAVIDLCVKLKLYTQRVCIGAVHVYKVEVLSIIDKLYLSPAEVCSVTFGNSCAQGYDPDQMWYVQLTDVPKPPLKPVVLPKPGMPTMRVLQLSDIHVDYEYAAGTNVNCGEPVCCRKNDGTPVGVPAHKWGSYGSCDLPNSTLHTSFQHLYEEHSRQKFDYVIFTGDIPAHYIWESSVNDTRQKMYDLTQLFLTYLPGVPVYFSLGNHEGVPVNSFPPAGPAIPAAQREHWLYQTSAETWSHWLPPDTRTTILRGGFYTTLIQPGLRLVSMNMNYCSSENWWVILNETDPQGQLAWLIQVLQMAEDSHEKVHIIGHIPPGSNCRTAWKINYFNIINRYEQTVVAQFYGHTHRDSYQVFFDPLSNLTRATAIAYVSPSLEAANSGNSGYRVYTIDGYRENTTSLVLDHSTYIFNLTAANEGKPLIWVNEYSAMEAYNMTSLLPSQWANLTHRMNEDHQMFNTFYNHYYKLHPRTPTCDDGCRRGMLCSTVFEPTMNNTCSVFNITQVQYHNWQILHESLC